MMKTLRLRSFDVNRYLDQQLEAPQPASVAQRFRRWAIRLNDRIERRMDSTDWIAFELKLERIGGCLLTGVGIYFVATLANAWLSGHFNLGGR